jgi:hypothetical protein
MERRCASLAAQACLARLRTSVDEALDSGAIVS